MSLPLHIFRDYDIRGIVNLDLTTEVVELIGRAIGSEVLSQDLTSVLVARDGRLHSWSIEYSLAQGIAASGCNVYLIGDVPTPMLYFGTTSTGIRSGVMITGSHNPSNYNGFKIVVGGNVVSGVDLLDRIQQGDLSVGHGCIFTKGNIATDYLNSVQEDIKICRPIKIVADAGNGITGKFIVRLLSSIGCEVVPLFCDVDGTFPNHHPDPSKIENLTDLTAAVLTHGADLGVSFDGDGDRLGAVTNSGVVIPADRLMMLFSKNILASETKLQNIVYDVKCTRLLKEVIESAGGNPIMSKTGHSHIKKAIRKTAAIFAGELSGHLFFSDRWFGFDDGLYAAARLVELVSNSNVTLDELISQLPLPMETIELTVDVSDSEKFQFIAKLADQATREFPNNSSTLDGIRLEFENSWGVLRASNTTPCLVGRFEGVTLQDLSDVKATFNHLLNVAKLHVTL